MFDIEHLVLDLSWSLALVERHMLVDIDSAADTVEIDNLMIFVMVDNDFWICHVGTIVWRHFWDDNGVLMVFVVGTMIVYSCHSGSLNNFDLDCGNGLLMGFVVFDHNHVCNFDCNLVILTEMVFDKIERGSTYLGHFLWSLEICFYQTMSFVVVWDLFW